MTYYETPGVLSDVANFISFYLNEEYVVKTYEIKFNENINHFLEYYYQMKCSCGDIPYELHPFAYAGVNTYSLIAKVAYEQPMKTASLSSLLDYFESDQFKLRVYHHWFDLDPNIQISDIKNIDILEKTKELSVSEQIKFRLIIFFEDFELYRRELIKVFTKLYDYAIGIRENQKPLIKVCKERFNDTECYRKFLAKYATNIEDFDYSLSFINSINYYYSDSSKFINFGVKSNYLIDSLRQISMETFAMAYGDKTRAKIVDSIALYQPICISDLRDILNIKHSTLFHHINILCEEGILTICNNKNKFYYKVNVEYYEIISKSFQERKRSNTKKMKRSIEFDYITLDSNKLVIFNPESGDTHFLNENASIVLKLLEQYPNVEDLIVAVSEEYDEDPAIIKADVHQTIAELEEKRVLVEVS